MSFELLLGLPTGALILLYMALLGAKLKSIPRDNP